MKNIKYITRKILNEIHSMDEWRGASLKIRNIDYKYLNDYLGKKDERPIGNNTVVRRTWNDEIAIRLWRTDIITVDEFNTITINTNGWWSKTTMSRLNDLLPSGINLYSKKGRWYISARNGTFPFKDGMKISSNYDVISS